MGLIKTALLIIGTSIGAGFLSGAELVRFFRCENFLPPVLLSSGVFFLLTSLFLLLGRRHGGYDGAVDDLFKRGAPAVNTTLSLLAFIPCAGMLAGLDALAPKLAPFLSLGGLVLVLVFLRKGMKGISALNAVLVPVLVGFVFFSACGGLAFTYPAQSRFSGWGIVYAGLNAFLAAPVLMDAGKTAKKPILSSVLAAAIVALCAVCVLGVVTREGESALSAELPFLFAMRESKLFYAASALAILTSLGSSLYPLLRLAEGLKGRAKNAAKGMILLAAFAFSRFGLKGIVGIFYPLMGCLGLIFSLICVFDEYFFQKHDEEVHRRRKQAENTGRAHHKVKLKYLTAVHDEVSKPRL